MTPKAGHLMSTYVFLMSLRVQRLPGNRCLYSMPNKHFYSCCYKSKRRTSAVEVAHIPKCSRTSLILHRLWSLSGDKVNKWHMWLPPIIHSSRSLLLRIWKHIQTYKLQIDHAIDLFTTLISHLSLNLMMHFTDLIKARINVKMFGTLAFLHAWHRGDYW